MASINIKTVQKPAETYQGFTYSDIKLDLEFDYTRNNELLKTQEIKDSINSLDYDAIKTSIFNLFTTIPGQKILNPYFGLNLVQYLFDPVSKNIANSIGNEILNGISTFEPRVSVKKIDIVVDEVNSQYIITLTVSAPRITNTSFKLIGTLSNSGFYFNN